MTRVLGRKRSYETVTGRILSWQGGGDTNEEGNNGKELHFERQVPRLGICIFGLVWPGECHPFL
jgi:hypothetical protein